MTRPTAKPAIELSTRLKDGLRSLRHGLRQSHDHLVSAGPPLPEPIAHAIERVTGRADRTAHLLGHASSRIARRVLLGSRDTPHLPSPIGLWLDCAASKPDETAAAFGSAAYRALGIVLENRGVKGWLVFEHALQRAFEDMLDSDDMRHPEWRLALAIENSGPVVELKLNSTNGKSNRHARWSGNVNRYCGLTLGLAMAAAAQSHYDHANSMDENENAAYELLDAAANMVEASWPNLEFEQDEALLAFINRYAAHL